MFVEANSTTLYTVSEATLGLKASPLLAIDKVKSVCGDGGEVPLTESNCFNKNGECDDEMLKRYLMQDDDDNERKTRARIALAYMVGQKIERKRDVLLESKRERRNRPRKKTRISRLRWYTDPVTRVWRKKMPKMSAWWEDFIDDPQPGNQHWAKEFRQNFRSPYASYVMILDMISSDQTEGLFDR